MTIQSYTNTPLSPLGDLEASPILLAQATNQVGQWDVLPYNAPFLLVHAALLRTGKVLFIAGSGNDPDNFYCGNCSAVWTPANGSFVRPATPLNGDGDPIDMFCPGHSFLPDGRLLCGGGTLQYDEFLGLPDAYVFNPGSQQWSFVETMNSGRWYPTLVTLGDGRVLALSGLDVNGDLDRLPEIYSDATGWEYQTDFVETSALALYAYLFLTQDGRIFYAGGQFGGNNEVSPRLLTLPGNGEPLPEQPVEGLTDENSRNQAACVLLPPAQDQRVMIIGGGNDFGVATDSVNIVDLKSDNPTYTPAANLNLGRMHHIAVLLPDRTVLVCGGAGYEESEQDSALPAEIYNPANDSWTLVAREGVPRVYHSVAILLPDGRVVTAGGNPERSVNELRLEVYRPPYLFKGTRPTINNAPSPFRYNTSREIQTTQTGSIRWVSLLRPMANTHGLDTEQRLVDLPFRRVGTTDRLNVTMTDNPNLAPPGWYMLFIVNNNGVPSVARWVQVLP